MELNDIWTLIKSVAEQNLIEQDEVIEILKQAISGAFAHQYDPDAELEFEIDIEKGIFKLYNKNKLVIEEEETSYPEIEIPLKEALKVDSNAKVGDEVKGPIDFVNFNRRMNQQITQLAIQGIKEAHKKAVYSKHKSLEGETITATVTQVGRTHAVLKLDDGSEAFMPPKFRNMKIKLKIGERIKVHVESVLEDAKSAQIIVSNGSTVMIKRLLEAEVPEIVEGIVQIMNISRVPGLRSKVAVKSNDSNIDAVGTIIGPQGSRIKSIIEKLDGEKVDVIAYSNDINEYVINAIAPARVVMIKDAGEDENHKLIITPNRHQTLAIGRGGHNATLVVELTKVRIDILSIDEAKAKNIEIVFNGNVKEEDLPLIESGEFINRRVRSNKTPSFSTNAFDDEISEFNANFDDEDYDSFMEDDSFNEIEDTSFEIKNDEIETIQEDFEFNDDFEGADIDDDFI